MTQVSESSKPVETASAEQSPELSPSPDGTAAAPATAQAKGEPTPFIPDIPARELRATWEMLVQFKAAIRENAYWPGDKLEAVAMGLNMITRMEAQYRVQVQGAEAREKAIAKEARAAIHAAGGQVQ